MTYSGSKAILQNDFDQWAMRNGYLFDAFSGEWPTPTAGEMTLLKLTVPAGQTWYRRGAWYTVAGSRPGQFKAWRTLPPKGEEALNLVVVPANSTRDIETMGKYPAGSSFRLSVKPDPLAVAGDVVTARLLYVALPWEE